MEGAENSISEKFSLRLAKELELAVVTQEERAQLLKIYGNFSEELNLTYNKSMIPLERIEHLPVDDFKTL